MCVASCAEKRRRWGGFRRIGTFSRFNRLFDFSRLNALLLPVLKEPSFSMHFITFQSPPPSPPTPPPSAPTTTADTPP
ncbi:hypothetical protein M427DRAFT_400661 [Gonapodya prolifera JEL478]|uniref:Uncharacterized protein n=1 Tax=Gonapodya prolifera (strain JEL478) TaxID=1344416 RepID=A0A139ATJ2_GONPJ|nr:hypothetical protein M427DRAFT_400661 [Gonapodya prolifera JEL478]|eukprot:KXS20042.1 hypothetical protein M427DRAFT_400661 [Gonapodya prolifera JEL478]